MARLHSFRFDISTDTNSDSQDDSRDETHSDSRKKPIYVGEPNVYAVDYILKKRKTNKKVEYLVKWKGYSSEDNSWQSAVDVSSDLIKEFENNKKKSVKTAATKRRSEVLQKSKEKISNGSINPTPIKKPKRTPKNVTQQLRNKDDLTKSVNLSPELMATSNNISMEKEQKEYEDQTGDETQAPNEAPNDAAVQTHFEPFMDLIFPEEEVQLPMTVVKESVANLKIPLGPLAEQKAVPIGASAPMQSSNKIRKKELHLQCKMLMQNKLVQPKLREK